MARFFRSDDIAVGDRVVARRQYGDADTPYKNAARGAVHSDVIGHVLRVDPLVIRPQQVGGYPSDLPAVEIPAAQLYVVKKLSPRTVRNSDIRRAEFYLAGVDPETREASGGVSGATTWTGDNQWFMRAGHPAVPLGTAAAFQPAPLAEIEAFYRRLGEAVRVAVPERIGKPAERLLTDPGWDAGDEDIVMHRGHAQNAAGAPYVVIAAADKEAAAALEQDWYLELYRRRIATKAHG